ncbi:MAG: hypothetical protein LBF87_07405 [Treponema sp.]|jgi:hypothetical protein|nr:hypothetical protein [Treponema sp.]
MKNFVAALASLALALLCMACVSVVEYGARVVDGSLFAEKTLAAYRSAGVELRQTRARDGTEYLLMNLDAFPFITLRAIPDESGRFELVAFQFLSSNLNGWNEFTLELAGSGVLTMLEAEARLRIDTLIPVEISAGEILHNGARLSGETALSNLRNRAERIRALAAWMRGITAPAFRTQSAFEAYWKPLVLPELTPVAERPVIWTRQGAVWKHAEDVAWNSTYTATMFPEALWTLRDSGALLRDWEEAVTWIYFVYQETYIIEQFSKDYLLSRIK